MTSEQAHGKPVDRRTDIWAFGCLLYELLTRRRAFAGETVSDQLASVLARDPDWKALPQDLDPRVSLLVHRCLEKDPRRRLCDIGDARLELEDVLAGVPGAQAAPVGRKILWPAVAAAFLLGGAAMGLWAWVKVRNAPPPPVARFDVPLPAGQRIIPSNNSGVMFAPDGSSFGYYARPVGGYPSFQRRFDNIEIKLFPGIPKGRFVLNLSPDGKWATILEGTPLQLKKVSLGGGPPTVLADVDMFGRGDWASDGYLYFTEKYPGAIYRVSENGGPKEPVTTLDAQKQELVHKHAQVLPGGKAILMDVVTTATESYDEARIELSTLDGKKRKLLVQGGFFPRFSPSGHIVYARGGSLYAVPFDLGSLAVTGPSVKVADGVLMSINSGAAYYASLPPAHWLMPPAWPKAASGPWSGWIARARPSLCRCPSAPTCSRASRPTRRLWPSRSKGPPTTSTPMTSPAA